MSKYRPYSRRALNSLFKTWSRRNRRSISFLFAILCGLSVLTTALLMLWPATPARWYALGVLHTALIAAFTHLLNSMFLTHEREAILHVRGAWGEENTRSELQRARRKRLIWGWVDSINLQMGDIDHLVVTREGGLVAIDSKWRSEGSTDQDEMVRSAERVKVRAEGVAGSILRGERGSHRSNRKPLQVLPVVVLWGAAQHEVPDGARREGIEFVGGRRLVSWLKSLEGQPVDRDAATDLLQGLERFRETSWNASSSPSRR